MLNQSHKYFYAHKLYSKLKLYESNISTEKLSSISLFLTLKIPQIEAKKETHQCKVITKRLTSSGHSSYAFSRVERALGERSRKYPLLVSLLWAGGDQLLKPYCWLAT